MRLPQDWVHHNLHTKRVSVIAGGQAGGARRVTLSADWVEVLHATPHVSEAGRLKMVERERRSVHARIWGFVTSSGTTADVEWEWLQTSRFERISYNPYASGSFVRHSDGTPWLGADRCWVARGSVWVMS